MAVRNGQLDQWEAVAGASVLCRIYTGTQPADCATAASGTKLVEIPCPSDWMANAAGGSKAKLGTWSAAAVAAGIGGYFRFYDSGGTTCHTQGTVAQQVTLATNALTAVNGNVLNFASTTGVIVGMSVSGTGIPTGATVVAVTSTTVTLSATSTAGVANAASITFGGDMNLDNTNIAVGQTVTVSAFSITAGNA